MRSPIICPGCKNLFRHKDNRRMHCSKKCFMRSKREQLPARLHRKRMRSVWRGMLHRCTNPLDAAYGRYAGRGIYICHDWATSFESFFAWANGTFKDGLTLERIDNDGPYTPENCTWATMAQQARNRRNTRLLTAWGEVKALTDWASDHRAAVTKSSIMVRLKAGWLPEEAIATPERHQPRVSAAMPESSPSIASSSFDS